MCHTVTIHVSYGHTFMCQTVTLHVSHGHTFMCQTVTLRVILSHFYVTDCHNTCDRLSQYMCHTVTIHVSDCHTTCVTLSQYMCVILQVLVWHTRTETLRYGHRGWSSYSRQDNNLNQIEEQMVFADE